ncbi:TIGR04219 family outer membrane beta-barrel protein [Pseudidiomarina sp. YC-516-91]|uniref:TIGR04219 family outer membrane beta-barrel protein n=1 Tax=Pseudidiomarina salilacus TaxID=3384452 RepID=UPI003985489A
MNKLSIAALLSAAVFAAPVSADTVFGVYTGAQIWQAETEGSFGSNSNNPNFAFSDEQQQSYFIAFEHPIPLIPNAKVRYNQLRNDGSQVLTESFEFFGSSYAANTSLNYTADFSHTDYTLYYELFDNDLLTFDLGATAKRVEGIVELRNQNSLQAADTDGWIPTLYSQVRIGIPATQLTVFGLANAISIADSKIEDYEFGIEYRPIENLAVDVNLQLGYRVFNIELDDLDEVYTDLEYSGPFLGVEFHF